MDGMGIDRVRRVGRSTPNCAPERRGRGWPGLGGRMGGAGRRDLVVWSGMGFVPALAGLSGWAAPVGPAESFTVFVVASPADAPEKQTVLVPAELVERLDNLTHPSGGAPRGVLLLSAAYEGTVAEANADFEAVFQI